MGNVQLADAVLPLEIVVVQQPSALVAARKTSRLADLVVEQPAPRVVEPPRDAVGAPPVQLDNQAVVPGSRAAFLKLEHVAKLRERPQELTARDGGRCRERPRLRDAVERIRDLGVQGRTQLEVLRIELIDIEAAAGAQIVTARAHVSHRDRHLARQLALDIDRVLLNAWGLPGLVHVLDLTADGGHPVLACAYRMLEAVRGWLV